MGLLDPSLLQSLLGGNPAVQPQTFGLFSRFSPPQGEGLLTSLLGSSDPRDPRGAAISALAVGLMRRNPAQGFENAMRTFDEYDNRNFRRAASELALGKSAMELSQMQEAARRDQAIQQERARMRGGEAFNALPNGSDNFGIPTAGEIPLFSMGSRPQRQQSMQPQQAQMQSYGAPSGDGGGGQGAGGPDMYRELLNEAQLYRRFGDEKRALEYIKAAEQFKPKYSTSPQLMKDPRTGKLVQVVLNEGGGYQILPFGAKPDMQLLELGGHVEAVDKNNAGDGRTWNKSQTQSDRIAAGNLALSRERFALDANTPQYVQTDEGYVALPKRPGAGPIVGQTVTGPGGEPLRAPGRLPPGYRAKPDGSGLEPIPGGPAALGKALPSKMVTDLSEQAATADSSGRFTSGFRDNYGGKTIAGDWSNTWKRLAGDDTGQAQFWQDYQLHEAGIRHKLFGASLTKGEEGAWTKLAVTPRMEPQQIRENLQRRKEIEEQGLNRMMVAAEKAGYNREQIEALTGRPVPSKAETAPRGQSPQRAATPLPANPSASSLSVGGAYQLPNGKVGVWDGFRFKVQ